MTNEVFVFVVCGSKEHIETLNFSLKYLNHFSQKDIVVLTDSSRNETAIAHDHIITVKTPSHFNHHQASIYLKTGIHRFLPKGNLYCYLDTDVIAISPQCDEIFKEFLPPILFAPDHCKVQSFSPYAINCNCLDQCAEDRKRFSKSLNKHDKNQELTTALARKKQKQIEEKYHQIQQSFWIKLVYAIKYYLSYSTFKLSREFYFDKKKRVWHTADGEIVKVELDVKKIANDANLNYTFWFNQWKNKKGENIFDFNCNHLSASIKKEFNITIKEKNWQHWNGGVFLFNDKSHAFLDAWHKKTMHIFELEEWKTRDQGTLIATAWEFNLENQPTLSKEWNFIADVHNKNLALNEESDLLTDDLFKTSYPAKFIHVFHDWKNMQWDIWRWIESKKPTNAKI